MLGTRYKLGLANSSGSSCARDQQALQARGFVRGGAQLVQFVGFDRDELAGAVLVAADNGASELGVRGAD